ncbi:MAG TPA: polyprenol monophosphomannose synthase [Candidatus Nanoarchaeia archaeon]|nr:polyprenol monophosphomannose synthase [Candidatus Nanoarchaeia archaeon]
MLSEHKEGHLGIQEFETRWDPRVSVVLPSYNEKENIEEAINRISTSLGSQLKEIIVVDDNSPDGTWNIVQKISAKNKTVRLIHRVNEKGLASALDDGVRAAQGNVIVWMDCDLGLPPEDIPRLVEQIKKYDVAIGSRYAKGGKDLRPAWRVALSTGLNLYSSLLLGWQVRDYTSGFVAVRKDVLDHVRWSRQGFGEYFAEFAYNCVKRGFDVTEVGYEFKDRTKGTSKTQGLNRLVKLGFQYGIKVLGLRLKKTKQKILPPHSMPASSQLR